MTGNELKQIRKLLGYTQKQMAEVCGYKKYQTINRFERGRAKIPKRLELMLKIIFKK